MIRSNARAVRRRDPEGPDTAERNLPGYARHLARRALVLSANLTDGTLTDDDPDDRTTDDNQLDFNLDANLASATIH